MTHPCRALTHDQLRRRTSEKWRRFDTDVLPLFVAEMDVLLPDAVVAAVTDAVRAGDTGYAVAETYFDALATFAQRRWGWTIPWRQMSLVPDVMLGAVELIGLGTGPGDAVVINPPVYPPFFGFIAHMDRRIVEAPLDENHRIDLAALERGFADAVSGGRSAAYLLCSPHNPTGTVHTAAELEAVADLAQRYGVSVVADEIHAPLVLPGARFVPYLTVPGGQRGFSLLSASKGWNLAGIKAAVAVAGEEAAAQLATLPEEVSHGASHLGVIAHAAALHDGGAWLDALLADLDANRRLLGDLLAEHLPGVRYRMPDGTYLAWLDCRGLALGDDPSATFLRRGRVALRSGPDFGTGGAGHVRLGFATHPDILTDAVRRMAGALG